MIGNDVLNSFLDKLKIQCPGIVGLDKVDLLKLCGGQAAQKGKSKKTIQLHHFNDHYVVSYSNGQDI